jgi:hypothetical protein
MAECICRCFNFPKFATECTSYWWFLHIHQHVHFLLALPLTFCHVTYPFSVSVTPLQYQCVIVMVLLQPFRSLSDRSTTVDNFFCAGHKVNSERRNCVSKICDLNLYSMNKGSSAGIWTGFWLDGRGKDPLFSIETRTDSGAHQPPILRVLWLFPWALNGRDVKLAPQLHLVPKWRIVELYNHFLIFLRGIMLNYAQKQLYVTFLSSQCDLFNSISGSILPVICLQVWGLGWYH